MRFRAAAVSAQLDLATTASLRPIVAAYVDARLGGGPSEGKGPV
jgi:hypothetical protein